MAKIVEGGAAELQRIETRIETVKYLNGIWSKFYQILILAFDPTATLEQHEADFAKIKQVISERHESLMQVVTHDQYIGQSILDMMRRAITLKTFRNLSDLEIRNTLIAWHNANILLHETMGDLTYDRDQMERQKELHLTRKDAAVRKNPIKDILQSNAFRNLIIWLVILGAIGGLVANWGVIEESAFYQDYLGFLHSPVNSLKGVFGAGDPGE